MAAVPVWTAFNATLYKTGDIGQVWGKFYYDWDQFVPYGAMREDFYNAYPDPFTSEWTLNCSILFTHGTHHAMLTARLSSCARAG